MNEFDAVVSRVRQRVEPDDAERKRLDTAVETLTDRTIETIDELPVAADVIQVGSTARDTWLAGDRDIDLFVSFPPDLDRDPLEEYGLEVGHAVLPDGHEEYAEHPYVVGEYDGFQVDLVPCYSVEDATAIQSAVDRTPFHSRYIKERLDDDLASDVRVCKQFFIGIGVYGSDLRTKGFSGFLTELLVLEHGGFRPLVEAAADWQPPVRFDPEDHGTENFDDPLVVMIDPTDPERNVAAVLSEANLARVQHYARKLLEEPREDFFISSEPDPLDAAAVRDHIERRETTPIAVRFETPAVVDDQLWPQLERSRKGIGSELERQGFDVFRTAAFANNDSARGDAVLLFELAVANRPRVECHRGPPVHVHDHAEGFYEKYADSDVYGPFIDGDRYVVEREREFASASELLVSDALFDTALGAHVESALEDGYDVLVGKEVAELAENFGAELGAYFLPEP